MTCDMDHPALLATLGRLQSEFTNTAGKLTFYVPDYQDSHNPFRALSDNIARPNSDAPQ